MDLKRVRQRCEATLRELDVPDPFDVLVFCKRLSVRRDRPIRLCPTDTQVSPCGVWLAAGSADYVFYEQGTSALHQEHIILHEVGHMLFRHVPVPIMDDEHAKLLLPDLDSEMVRWVLARTSYSDAEEQEAEMLASLILERAGRSRAAAAPV